MNLYAIDDRGRVISAGQAVKQRDYQCRECGAVVRLRGGIHRQHHFYHLSHNRSCVLSGKSLSHLQVQYYLQRILPDNECALEWRFEEIGRIADVVWFTRMLVFEVQCSDITVEEVEKRNADYQQLGFTVIWILHDHRYNKQKIHPVELFLRSRTFYYTNISSDGEGVIYDQYDIIDEGMRKNVVDFVIPDCSKPRDFLFTDLQHLSLPRGMSRRLERQLFFEGDIVSRCLSGDGKSFVEKLRAVEWHYLSRKRWKGVMRFFDGTKSVILRLYFGFFRMMLERACR